MTRTRYIAALLVCYGLLAAMRLTTPYDIDERDQAKQGLYVLDVVQRGSFFLPMERGVKPATKPPLYNWIAAAFSAGSGEVTDFTIRLPAVLSGAGVVVVTFLAGELLFSGPVGLCAGMILLTNSHFLNLSCTARTDMMLCFFVSLALYFFLRAHRRNGKVTVFGILACAAMGLGSITKGPVAFLVPALTVLAFLFIRKDLKALRSMRLGWGIAIWLGILLGWFIPALIEGGRVFFDTVIYDEMVNRFFGVGTRTEKGKPFYYLVTNFLGRFFPWSLLVPSALARYWKSKDEEERGPLLFPAVWFLVVLVFFSLSKGKRSDYLLPLYPAASVIVAHFWISLTGRAEAARWTGHVRAVSLGSLLLTAAGVAGLGILAAAPVAGAGAEVERLTDSVGAHAGLFVLIASPLVLASAAGVVLAIRRRYRPVLIAMLVVMAAYAALYFELLSPETVARDGEKKRAFCAAAAGRIGPSGVPEFHAVKNSLLFYMGRNVRKLDRDEVERLFREKDRPFLITTEAAYGGLSPGPDFRFAVLERSEPLAEHGTRYVLLGKAAPE